MRNKTFDIIVIGSGPGGEGAAMKSAKEGKQVAIVDDFSEVGGRCTHLSTIPSKALLHSVRQLAQGQRSFRPQFPALLKSAGSVIDKQVAMRRGFYERNRTAIINGFARFVNPNQIEVHEEGSMPRQYAADAFILATGARPYHPPEMDFTHPRILDSDTVLHLDDSPRSITIYGAGVIGCEYASIFRGLDVRVNLVNNRHQLLSFLDDEIIDALSYHLREQGAIILHNEEAEGVEATDNGVTLHLKSNKQVQSDYLLWVQGRTGNTHGLGLEDLGIEVDSRGYVKVNEKYQTALPHIYAVGDVVGYPSLASAAYDQGRFAATHCIFNECASSLVEHIPTGIYTIPEISSVGFTEKELTTQKIPYEVGRSFFRHLARAQITGETIGILKLLFHRESLELLGIHCFGSQATEIIHIGQAVMSQSGPGNSLLYFVNTTFNYPTMAEAYRVAALNGLNRVRPL